MGALVRAGPARERERSSRRDAGDLGSSGLRCSVSETRCNGGAFRDRSSLPWALSFGHPWPNRSLQAPPLPRSLGSGTATGQNTAWTFLRSGACGGEFPKERRDRVGPSRTVFGQGWPNAELTGMYSQRVLDGPTRSRCGLSGEKSFWNPAGWLTATLSRAGPACMVSRQVLRKRLVGVEGPGPLLTVAYRLWETWPHPAPSNADKESIG